MPWISSGSCLSCGGGGILLIHVRPAAAAAAASLASPWTHQKCTLPPHPRASEIGDSGAKTQQSILTSSPASWAS